MGHNNPLVNRFLFYSQEFPGAKGRVRTSRLNLKIRR
jgi:hypothetical protein